ncbi:MAG: hypothetical protein ACK5BO_04895, partial [Bacteroidota bacterium]
MSFKYLILYLGIAIPSAIYSQSVTPKKGKTFVFPIVTKSLETGWNFGALTAKVFSLYPSDTVSRSSNLEFLAMASTRKQVIIALNGTQY